MRDVLSAARRYAQRGWPVFPCNGKRPLTAHGLKDATTDGATLVKWWQRWPDANVAVCTGAASGLVVLDVDGETGADSLHELERQHGELLTTASVTTPHGGSHYYFRHPGGEIRNSASQLGAGLDIRGDGGYVLTPPSAGYHVDEEAPVAKLPGWLAMLVVERSVGARPPTPASEWRRIAAGVTEGQRNDACARLAGHLFTRGVDPYLTRALVIAWNATYNRPPLSEREVDQVVNSIARLEARKLRNAA